MWFHKQSSLQSPGRHTSARRLRLAGFAVLGLFVLAAVVGMNFSRFAAYLKQGVSASSSSQVSSSLQNNILSIDQQPVKSSSSTAVLTYKNDTFRSGQTDAETTLTTKNVNASQFGKRISYKVDGRVYAQPLYVPHLKINGVEHDVVFVVTEHDSVYAFDAGKTSTTGTNTPKPLWHTSFLTSSSITPMSHNDVHCPDIGGDDVGVTGTPVIDLNKKTLYVVGATKEHGKLYSKLYALDITTGKQKAHSPSNITATLPGNGPGSVHGKLTFDVERENQRAGLLLLNGVVYIAWGSNCDIAPYYGWLMGYDASTLKQVAVYNPEQNTGQAGIWQSGAGLAADKDGNIYLITGEGDFNLNTGGSEAGDSLLKLSTQHGLHVADSFTPYDQECMGWYNEDFGSGGPLLLPNTSEVIASGKEGRIYVLNRNHLGGYNTVANACNHLNLTNVDQVTQELPANTAQGGVWGSPAYWHSSNGDYVYVSGRTDNSVKAFQLTDGKLSSQPTSQSPVQKDKDGKLLQVSGNPVVSSNGTQSGTGIVWILDSSQGDLCAYDAANLAHLLYTSDQKASRDSLGQQHVIKFSVPTVADGKVFVGTDDSLLIYGLLKS